MSTPITMPASTKPTLNSVPQLEQPPPQCIQQAVPAAEGDIADADHAVTNPEDHGSPTQLTPKLHMKKKLSRELRNLMPHNMSPEKTTADGSADGSQSTPQSEHTDLPPHETLSERPRRITKPVKRYDAQSGT